MTAFTTVLEPSDWLSGNSVAERAIADAGIPIKKVAIAEGKKVLVEIDIASNAPPEAVSWWTGTASETWDVYRKGVAPSRPAMALAVAKYAPIKADELPEERDTWAIKIDAEKYITPGYYWDRWFKRVGAKLVRVVMYKGGTMALVIVSVPKGTLDPSAEMVCEATRTTPTASNSELLTVEERTEGRPITLVDLVDEKIQQARAAVSGAVGTLVAIVIAGVVVYVAISALRRR